MLSFMYNIINNVFGYKYFSQPEEDDIDVVIARLESLQKEDALTSKNEETCEEICDEEGSYYKTGNVTFVNDEYILIDNCYMCETTNVLTSKPKVGDIVCYFAYKKNENNDQKIYKIISIIEESWDDTVIVPQTNIVKVDILTKTIIGKVISRKGRKVFIDPNDICIDLDKINSEFIPIVGDWLQLECLVEFDDKKTDLTGKIIEINKILPLRSKLDINVITVYDPIKEYGTIGKTTVFNKAVCESGYIPYVGDKVASDTIESDQGIYSWRSLTVVPLLQVPDKTKQLPIPESSQSFQIPQLDLNTLIKDKCGIIISNDLKINVNIQEEKDIFVLIQNTSSTSHMLCKGCFMSKKAQSQLSLVWPEVKQTTILNPSATISYQFKCNAKFVGISEELFIFIFKGFQIGRIFQINVESKNILDTQKRCTYKRDNYVPFIDKEEESMYVPGIRPCKPPAFIKMRNGVFKVPKRFWDTVLNNLNKSQVECEIAIGNAIPCLLQRLCFETYRDRFHALLYLEEIDQTFAMQQYDMESAVMKHCGEYLSLKVLGLAEKRPSLLIGDKAIISFKWDKHQGKLKYEGYIHKVTSTEIFLKFNKKFQQEYKNEDCQVSFRSSTTVMQRCHNAVNLAVLHLGPEFLFPTRVITKDPQVILDEVDSEEKAPSKKGEYKRNGSVSSVSSSTTSDSSDSTTKSLPRVSVAERLFKVKPIEQPKNITGYINLVTVNHDTDNTKSIGEFNKDKDKDKDKDTENDKDKDTENDKDKDAEKNKDKDTEKDKDTSVFSDIGCKKEEDPDSSNTSDIDAALNKCISQIKKRKLIWFNKNLNYYQKEAVKNILKGLARPLPYVIFGPPGTGKTVTLCETILQLLTILPESRLLIATPSNSSANLILERLLDSKILKPGDVVRLIAHHCLDDGTIPKKLLPYCATADIAKEGTRHRFESSFQGPKINCTMSTIGRHRITIGTCIALGVLYNMGFSRSHFSHVLIDEAGQATEPEIMVPLSFIHASHGQVVLAGDPLQLGPVVQSKLAKQFGLEESFLSRLLYQFPYQRDPEGFETCYDPRLVTKLIINYRSLPEILELPNSLFYNSELQAKISSKNSDEAQLLRSLAEELPERTGLPPAILFHGIKGKNLRDSDSPSWYNPEEATQVYIYLLRLYNCGILPEDIGIITPYQKQVLQIRQLLWELNIVCPKISSVEGFQGQERKIIILSTVRSSTNFIAEDIKHALGFIASPKRLNVAITRARALLIILGNAELLAEDPYWRSVLIYCLDRNSYIGCNFVPFHLNNSFIEKDSTLDET
ncbi:probable RNA helicase armi isoform X2 [Vespa mandarinia]|uniref:probable RNA helicase armi isoform X2 n=1 Tax=Vespa mandarinia TaxID=7446 RepID=UPI00161EF6E0|nr:probable RNA helicase armi isoform X2 [Vespa mandarinia]